MRSFSGRREKGLGTNQMDILSEVCLSWSPQGPTLRQRFKHKRFIWEMKVPVVEWESERRKKSQPIKVMLSHQLPWSVTGAQSCGKTLENDTEHRPQNYLARGAMELWSPYTKSPSLVEKNYWESVPWFFWPAL